MKNILCFLSLFLWATSGLASVCDGAELAILNSTGHALIVEDKYPDGNTTIRHIHPNDKIMPGEIVKLHMYSGNGSHGKASGSIVFLDDSGFETGENNRRALAFWYRATPQSGDCRLDGGHQTFQRGYNTDIQFDQGALGFPGTIYLQIKHK